ncbi:hypothetical protein [Paenibacillus sp. MMS20-IR301]|uniref:hypothetical protein n=1 Tax=Paenibacillus sp. MMS20-IR301 TaxID=2895946 RepID=UPI0028E9E53E|nr:hypothetical protein [Paenibacillus sp. MMS20-IR301]WNS41045.1 hypothetical protein LOS79_18555 [Paenibacillus sp. MMS20-IR301]
MPHRLSASLIQSLNSLRHNALLVSSGAFIRFANRQWDIYNQLYGFSGTAGWRGENVAGLFGERLADPQGRMKLELLLGDVFQGRCLASSTELEIMTKHNGQRIFRFDLFPLITGTTPDYPAAILTLNDTGHTPASQAQSNPDKISPITSSAVHPDHRNHYLVPICAACKSIRTVQEEWIPIERFLQQQLSLQFTHDICPGCIRALYPKYAAALKW